MHNSHKWRADEESQQEQDRGRDEGDEEVYFSSSTWVLVTADRTWFEAPSFKGAQMRPAKMPAKFRPWTDDYSNLFQILTLND